MERKVTQKQKILEYIRRHGSITPKDAEGNGINSMRLAARIGELQKDGYAITKTMETYTSRDGSVSRYARYRLEME